MKNRNIHKHAEKKHTTNGSTPTAGHGPAGSSAKAAKRKGCSRRTWNQVLSPNEVESWWGGLSILGRVYIYWVVSVLREANDEEALAVAKSVRDCFGMPKGTPGTASEPDVRNN